MVNDWLTPTILHPIAPLPVALLPLPPDVLWTLTGCRHSPRWETLVLTITYTSPQWVVKRGVSPKCGVWCAVSPIFNSTAVFWRRFLTLAVAMEILNSHPRSLGHWKEINLWRNVPNDSFIQIPFSLSFYYIRNFFAFEMLRSLELVLD